MVVPDLRAALESAAAATATTDQTLSTRSLTSSTDVSAEELSTLRAFLQTTLGDSAYYAGIDFLRSMVGGSDQCEGEGEGGGGGGASDDERLIAEMEEIVGEDGLQYLDSMFRVITAEDRLDESL